VRVGEDAYVSDRELIVNADDFGRSELTNAGIIRAFEDGIVTSASLMVRWPAAPDAARYVREHRDLSVGLHLDLSEWIYLDGEWAVVYEVDAPPDQELERQLAHFRLLVGRDPTHLDSHQHVHLEEPVASLLGDAAAALGVPLRGRSRIPYWGDFYGQSGKGERYPQGITVASLISLIERLPAGTTEFGCHPGLDAELDSSYRLERLTEVRTLCDPRVKDAIVRERIRLRSF
jgi:predicted glycoside hydrolase/deacetylase ChbG (UPF0249 family)